MPTLVEFSIPVLIKSPKKEYPIQTKGKSAAKPRTDDDEPLPIRPSGHAPRNARIIGRIAEPDRVSYTLELGGINIDDVGIDEVLDYVSAYDLEQFENQQFVEEREVMRVARIEAELEAERRRERQKMRAKRKGTVIHVDSDDYPIESSEPVEGKHDRARPTYKHLFKKLKERRRRKRDPATGELMPLSDEEDIEIVDASSDDERPARPSPGRSTSIRPPLHPGLELPKRRRRKRDKVTGELLPLTPVDQPLARPVSSPVDAGNRKRPRRRRHPVTGELMPLGWRYDPEAEQNQYSRDRSQSANVPSMRRLSIAREHEAKRVKLTSEERSSDEMPSQAVVNPSRGPAQSTHATALSKFTNAEMEILESEDDELEASRNHPRPAALALQRRQMSQKTSMMHPNAYGTSGSAAASSAQETSQEPITLASFLKSPGVDRESSSDDSSVSSSFRTNANVADRPKTSIMNPLASQAEAGDDGDEELDEDEFFVEAILGHHMSDPRTHPQELGKKSAMLYKVKWQGWPEPTWEPFSSFADPETVLQYRASVGLDNNSQAEKVVQAPTAAAPAASKPNTPQPTLAAAKVLTPQPKPKSKSRSPTKTEVSQNVVEESDDEDSEEDDGYEIESILAHHMSDPRTHPGREPTMLYQVKWVGYSKPTWEPIDSFVDQSIVKAYRKKVGL